MTIDKDGGELRVVRRIYKRVTIDKHLVVIKIYVGKKQHSQHRLFIYMLLHVELEQHRTKNSL
jgi:hypothetical protein